MASRGSIVLAALFVVSCGGDDSSGGDKPPAANQAPVVDGVDAPSSLTATNGVYETQVHVSYHDDDDDTVSQVRLQIPAGHFDQTTPIQQATPANHAATITLQLQAATARKGTYDYTVSVIDAAGLESAPVTKQLTLQ